MSATADVSANTMVSGGTPIPSGATTATAAPGATGPGGQMSILTAVVTTLGVGVVGLVVLRKIFGGKDLPPVRVDAVNAFNVYWSWLVIDGTLKLVAYKFHGHKLAQAYLLIA